MSELRLKRLEFRNRLVQQGMPRVPTLQEMLWLKRFHEPVTPDFTSTPRLLNHFKLGADPEFIFEQPANPEEGTRKARVDAFHLGLKPGLFAGADQNGRLVEIRPTPHCSTLYVVGSILESLRWLAILYPTTTNYAWCSGAFLYDDGLGGHIHIGRKQPTRALEVNALDAINKALEGLGLYPTKELAKRRTGDAHGQQYGLPGQYRLQTHGYEYRTPPSWLDSPWLAFFCLTLAKVAILNPGLVAEWLSPDIQVSKDMVLNLLAYYKGQDDDAALAHSICLRHGLPRHVGKDFRERWGVDYAALHKVGIDLMPNSVAPSKQTIVELVAHLTAGTPIPRREPKPSWSPLIAEKGFIPAISQVKPKQIGMGELLWDVMTHEKFPIQFYPGESVGESQMLTVSLPLIRLGGVKFYETFKKIAPPHVEIYTAARGDRAGELFINISRAWRRDAKRLQLVKKVLLSGMFPLWLLKDAKSDVLSRWEKPISEKKMRGTEVMALREGER